jgi:hypothetical protein
MKFLTSLLLYAITITATHANETMSSGADTITERLDFVANIQRFQGMFDSVATFCEGHVPASIFNNVKEKWLIENRKYLELRDKELDRALEIAAANGTTPEGVDQIRRWVNDQYESRLRHDRMYKDLIGTKDLTIPCSRRLGEMISESMSLKTLSPASIEYAHKFPVDP